MANELNLDIETVLKRFFGTVMAEGVPLDKASGLVGELITLVQEKRHDEWFDLVNKAVEEAKNKEGVTL